MGVYLVVLIFGLAFTLIASLIAGLKDNVLAAQVALSLGVLLEFVMLITLILSAIKSLGVF